MTRLESIPGFARLWEKTCGDPRVCVAVLDGPVDLTHPCFDGADLRRVDSHWTDGKQVIPEAIEHATHITSLVLGQHGTCVEGIAPHCRVINVPVIYDPASMLDPIALTHAVNLAFREGANIIHVASCIPTKSGSADDLVARAIRTCIDNNVLIVAPAGNDKGECFCVPAAISGVLAVGAADEEGKAARFSNWGGIYQEQGVLAPGIDIVGAAPGGKTSIHKGTSCAAPIVTGAAALLMSVQLNEGWPINARNVRDAILGSASPCETSDHEEQRRCLAGMLSIPNAVRRLYALSSEEKRSSSVRRAVRASNVPGRNGRLYLAPRATFRSVAPRVRRRPASGSGAESVTPAVTAPTPPTLIAPSAYGGADDGGLVFFIGRVDFDFGTEARRDTFKQQMPPALFKFENNVIVEVISEVDMDEAAIAEKLQQHYFPVPPNPFDPRQMVAYLKKRPDEARSLIWTLNLELTPIYSVEPVGPFADQVYDTLVKMLEGQSQAEGNMAYVERVSVPAVLSGQSVRLFSGQVVSQLLVDARRGMYSWQTNDLIQKALDAVAKEHAAAAAAAEAREQAPLSPPDLVVLRNVMREVLNKLYYQYRNLGITSPDRALNFAATNLFQLTTVITSAFLDPKGSKTLERVDVVKSPYGRVDSDCWDVQLKFLDPNNTNRAYSVFRFTLDVSDKLPVTMGPIVDYISVT